MATYENRGGTWRVKIRAKGYPAQTKTFNTKIEAQSWAKVIESEMTRGVFVSRAEAEATTLHEALDRYSREVSPLKKGEKQELVRIKFWQTDNLATRTLASLQPKDFATWRDNRLKTVSASTVQKDLALISHVFTICNQDWGISIQNPIQNISKPTVNNSRSRRLVDNEEVDLFNALAKSRNKHIKAICELAIETAMRQSEILGIDRSDIKENHIHLSDTKNGTFRDVPLSSKAKLILEPLLKNDGLIFPTTQQAVIQAFVRACARSKIKDLKFHDLRHEATSRLAEKLQMHELMKVTGHKDPKMLARYFHPKIEDLARKLG
jgi:integrase